MYFPKGDIPSDNLPSDNYPKAPKSLGDRALRLGQAWEVVAWKKSHLGSCHLGKYAWEVAA